MEVENGTRKIETYIQDAFDELDDKSRICDEYNCICNKDFENCPFQE